MVMYTCFLETGISTFDLAATTLYNELDGDPTKKTPTEVLEQMRDKYVSLTGKNMWPHKSQKQKQDELSAMKSTMNTLQQKVDSFTKKGGSGSGNNNNSNNSSKAKSTADHSDKTCYGCGKKGHIRPNCPDKKNSGKSGNSGGSSNNSGSSIAEWMLKAPATGESEVKTVDGVEYKWCSKCKLGKDKKPMWRSGNKRHVTSECRTKQSKQNALATSSEEVPVDGPLRFAGFP